MLIFDMDGTLWDTTKTTLEAANIVADEYSEVKPFEMTTVKRGMGLSSKENAKNYFPYLEEEKGLFYLSEIGKENFKLINKKGAYIYDGVLDTLKSLSKKYKLGIITNNTDDYAKLFIDVSGLKEFFTDYMGAASYGITKGEAIKKMVDKYNDKNNYYIGDIKKDMDSTLEAGIIFIHARYGFEPDLECDKHIDDISELESVL